MTHALKGEGHDGSEDGTGRGVPLVPVTAGTLKASNGGVSGKDAPHVVAFNARQDPDVSGAISGPLDTDPGTQAIAFAENSRAEVRLEGGDGRTTGSLKTGGGKPGQSYPVVAAVSIRGREGGSTAEMKTGAAPALKASQGGGDKPHVMAAMSVRRLTPVEYERLMGVPDNYTRIPDRTFAKRPKGKHFRRHRYLYEKNPDGTWTRFAADGPRYKALGNSIAVPCLRHIGENLARALGLETGTREDVA